MCRSLQVDIATSNILHTDLPFIHSLTPPHHPLSFSFHSHLFHHSLSLPPSLFSLPPSLSLSLYLPRFTLAYFTIPSLSLLCHSADLMSKSHLDILLLFDLVYFGRLTIYGYMLYIYTSLLYHSDAIPYIALAVQYSSLVRLIYIPHG